jgi:hypothetical protein
MAQRRQPTEDATIRAVSARLHPLFGTMREDLHAMLGEYTGHAVSGRDFSLFVARLDGLLIDSVEAIVDLTLAK